MNSIEKICECFYGLLSADICRDIKFRFDSSNMAVNTRIEVLFDRVKLCAETLFLPIQVLFCKRCSCNGAIDFIIGAGAKDLIFENCIRHYFNNNVASIGKNLYYKEGMRGNRFWKIYLRFLVLSFSLLFDEAKYKFSPLLYCAFRDALSVYSLKHQAVNFYGFYINHPLSYLTMLFACGHGIGNVYAMFEVFLDVNRYFSLPVKKGFFLSKPMISEVEYYKTKSYFKLENYEYLGSINMFGDTEKKGFDFDIGFFSTGAWARDGGESRALEYFEKLNIGDSLSAKIEHQVFYALVSYAKANGLTVKYYLHPYEKLIFSRYGATPPEYELVDDQSVFFESYESNKKLEDRFAEPRVAVAVRSSSILERFNLGYDNNFQYDYMGVLPCSLAMYDKKALGAFSKMFYKDTDELLKRIDECLKKS